MGRNGELAPGYRAVRYGICKIPYVVTIYMAYLRHADLWVCVFSTHMLPLRDMDAILDFGSLIL